MYRKCIVLVAGLAPLVLGLGFMTAQEKNDKDPKRIADRAAILALTKQMTDAFNKRDAQTVDFPLELAADSEGKLTYSVHYSW